jgi:hypothetical protein
MIAKPHITNKGRRYPQRYAVTNYSLRKGDNGCIEFECDVPDQTSQPYYGIEFVIAGRYPSGGCNPGSGTGCSGLYWDDVTNPNCVATLFCNTLISNREHYNEMLL